MGRLLTVVIPCLVCVAEVGCHSQQPVASTVDGGGVQEQGWITVSGQALVLPQARRLLSQREMAVPALQGLQLRLEDPLRASLADPDATLFEEPLATDGAFVAKPVDARLVSAALSVYLFAATTTDFLPCSTVIYDTGVARSPLLTDLESVQAFALPRAFARLLSSAVTGDSTRLGQNGFLLGQVLDAHGLPVAHVRLVTLNWDGTSSTRSQRIFYPSVELALGVTQDATHDNGLFVYMHDGSDPQLFQLGVGGRDEYPLAGALVRAGAAQWLTLAPRIP